MGTLVDRIHRELSDEDVAKIAGTYHAWRGDKNAGEYTDVPGFCKTANIDDIRKHGHLLTPGRFVGAEEPEDDAEPFEEKMCSLVALDIRPERDRLSCPHATGPNADLHHRLDPYPRPDESGTLRTLQELSWSWVFENLHQYEARRRWKP
jgi:hypothetical protein